MQVNPRPRSYIAGPNMCAAAIRQRKVVKDGPPRSNLRVLNVLRGGGATLFYLFHFVSKRGIEICVPCRALEPARHDHSLRCIGEVKISGAFGCAAALVGTNR